MKATEEQQKKSARELSSGKKVNSAADDAAVLAITQKIAKEAQSLKTGSNNISYGIDATKIADGALSNISDSLGDIEQNTVRAMNGLYSDSDRAVLQEANKQSVETINQTINQAKYNEKNPLENFDIPINPDKIDTAAVDETYSKLSSMRSQIGAETNGLEAAYDVNNNTYENLTAAQSRAEDTDFAESVTKMKNSAVVNQAQNMVLKNQIESQEHLVSKMFQS
jgi:flagellin